MRRSTVIPATLLAAAAAAAPAAHASHAFNNQDASVRCEHYTVEDGVTICVNERARAAQPECTPPGANEPAVTISRDFIGAKCWNQGQQGVPENLRPFTVRQYGQIVVFAAPGGDIFVFDTKRLALVQAGATNKVLFPGLSGNLF